MSWPPMPSQTAIAELATHQEITSSHIYYNATPSASYAAYRRVVDGATREEVLALLSSPHAVTRGYMARHVIEHWPDDARALYPLLHDSAQIQTIQGCNVGDWILGHYVFHEIGGVVRQSATAMQVYLDATVDPRVGSFRARGLSLLVESDPDTALEQALSHVRVADNDSALWSSLWVLEKLARPEDVPILATIVDHPAATFRNRLCEPVARLARTCQDARVLLDRLRNDPWPQVRELAKEAAQRHLGGEAG